MKILVLGGYGTFGGRLVRLLAEDPRVTLVVAGRSREKAAAFCKELVSARLQPAAFDRDGDAETQLAVLSPDLVVDASGPFQDYGNDPYRIVRAALAHGISYIDLADASGFVNGIAQFDGEAQSRGLFVLSGASSFPLLTAAVVRRLSQGMTRLDSVAAGIAPSPYADIGLNVIRAIASYAGKPVELLRDGSRVRAHALIDVRRFVIAPPGCIPLLPRRFTLIDAPDLGAISALWPELRDMWVGVGTAPVVWHRLLSGVAQLVRVGVLRSLAPMARLMHTAMGRLRWGEHRGGMFVAVKGEAKDGRPVERAWHMIAEGDDGPFIPAMAAAAIIGHCLAGAPPAPGARAALRELELSDYEALFARRAIATGMSETMDPAAPLYHRLLGEACARLPPSWRAMRAATGTLTASGVATIERGRGPLARLAAWVMQFPPAAKDVPVSVTFSVDAGRERWVRRFGAHSFASTHEAGRGRFEGLLCERFGPLTFGMALAVEEGRMRLVMRRWSFCDIPMPSFLAPRSDAYEFDEDGRFNFHVAISHPLTGFIVRYRGWLVPTG